jgi:hypothetical protein
MKKNNFALILMLAFTLGCKKSDNGGTTTGNPLALSVVSSSQNKTIALNSFINKLIYFFIPRVNALPPPSTLLDAHDLTVNLTQTWFVIKEVEFKNSEIADANEVDGAEVSLPGPYVVNLFSSTPTKIGDGEIQYSSIRRIKMKLSKLDSSLINSSTPAALNSQSVFITGSVLGNTFTFTSSEEVEYEISGPNEIATSNVNSNLLVSINIANLIRKIDLSQVTNGSAINENNKLPASNPCPLIDSSAQDVYTCFKLGLKSEANLGKDSDGNGELSSTEETVHD